MIVKRFLALTLMIAACIGTMGQERKKNIVDEVIWVVGDSPILLSEVEETRVSMELMGESIEDPYTTIAEKLAIDKLYLHQAELDSIEVNEQFAASIAEEQVNAAIQMYGSRENAEAVIHKSIAKLREQYREMARTQQLIQGVSDNLTRYVKVTPAEVRDYFSKMPEDSLPFINTQVEVQIITSVPQVSREEVDKVENKLREIAQRINSGEKTFAQMAKIYSQDGSARYGGELGLSGRGQWVQEFADVAFSLTDPNKVSRIVRTEFGFHIMQLIEKRGDKVNVRHIIIKPEIAESEYDRCLNRLDSIATDIREGKFTFDEAAHVLSDDKDTKFNRGIMANMDEMTHTLTSRFEMKDLPQDIAKIVAGMGVGEISPAVRIINEKTGSEVCAIIRPKNRIEGQRANMAEDFQVLRGVVEADRKKNIEEKWLQEKIRTTYTRIAPEWRGYKYKYDGWIK